MRPIVAITFLFVFASMIPASAVHAQGTDRAAARAAYDRAVELEGEGQHEAAAAAYRAAYQLGGGRELTYVIIGQSPDGSSAPLLDALSRLLDGAPADRVVDTERAAEGPQDRALSDAAPGAPQPSAEVAAETSPSMTRLPGSGETDTPEAPLHQNEVGVLSWALAGLGAAALLGGGVTGLLAIETEAELDERCTDRVCPIEEEGRLERGRLMATLSTGLLIGGGAALAAGVLIGLLWPTDDPADAEVTAGCTDVGCFGAVGASF